MQLTHPDGYARRVGKVLGGQTPPVCIRAPCRWPAHRTRQGSTRQLTASPHSGLRLRDAPPCQHWAIAREFRVCPYAFRSAYVPSGPGHKVRGLSTCWHLRLISVPAKSFAALRKPRCPRFPLATWSMTQHRSNPCRVVFGLPVHCAAGRHIDSPEQSPRQVLEGDLGGELLAAA
jgi:hypothetical protein